MMSLAPSPKFLRDFDWLSFLLIIGLMAFGVVQIHSAKPSSPSLWQRQIYAMVLGLIIMFVVTKIDYNRIFSIAPYLYGFGLFLLVLVLLIGTEINGNKNWLQIGPIGGQPSELAKIFTLLMLVRYLSDVRVRPLNLKTIATAGAIWLAPTLLVFLGKDTGSTLSYISFFAVLLFLCGLRWSWIAAGLAVVVLAGLIAIPKIKASTSYQAERIKAVYWPDLAAKRYRYQNEQSYIAIGSGGPYGKGIGSGTQGPLGFVPEVHSDFIFTIAGEETGFLGCSLALGAYLIIIWRLIEAAQKSRDRQGTLLVAGYTGLLLYHVTVSVGMVVGLLPIMGIPLPLMSHGGSSILATLFALGLCLSVRLRRFVN
ncbi:MAG: rod shape-determining protein RodA [Blastocatellia bacterium]|nr:rod shape-determining protein RodA [Blastocatellia bacterium]